MSNNNVSIGEKLKKNLNTTIEVLWKSQFNSNLENDWDIESISQEQAIELKRKYTKPLALLLSEYLLTGKEELLAIYLDERLRYAPHQQPLEVRNDYHKLLVHKELDELVKEGILEDSDKEYWLSIHKPLLDTNPGRKVSLLAVGDCLLNEVRVFTTLEAFNKKLNLDFRCIYFSSNYRGLNPEGIIDFLNNNTVDIISFSFFTFDAFPGFRREFSRAKTLSDDEIEKICSNYIASADHLINEIRSSHSQPIILHNISGLPLPRIRRLLPFMKSFNNKQAFMIDTLNSGLLSISRAYENILLLDEYAIARDHGLKKSMVEPAPQKKYKGMFHTSCFGKHLSEAYTNIVSNYLKLSRCKVILVDFDNTLWSGVMSEGTVSHFKDRQALLKQLKDSGIILVAVSKNSPESIRWDEMFLKQEDFALLKISWDPKVKSIIEASEELNLGKDSFILLDDNRHERIQVENEIPEVICLDSNLEETWSDLEMMLSFPNTQSTEEAKLRTKYYQEQVKRKAEISSSINHEEMLSKLNLWYKIDTAKIKHLSRVHELISRTNQFNTTTQRLTKDQVIEKIESSDHVVYITEMGDKFGSLGIVCVALIDIHENVATIDSFILSCRAIGFNLESQVLHEIESRLLDNNISKIKAPLIETDRNQPCLDFYSSHGYEIDPDSTSLWVKSLSPSNITPAVNWLSKKTDITH
jgi:FkbH-like protein